MHESSVPPGYSEFGYERRKPGAGLTRARLFIGALIVGFLIALWYILPPLSFPVGEVISIPSGLSARGVGTLLESRDVVRSGRVFAFFVGLQSGAGTLQTGDYVFERALPVWMVSGRIEGARFGIDRIRLTFPEGISVRDMAIIIEKAHPTFPIGEFKTLAQTREGYLFPDTYFITRTTTAEELLARLEARFEREYKKLDLDNSSTRSQKEIVIMASILEREARNGDEAKVISGILWKRIERGMPLQVDATFLYRIGKGSSSLTLSDLASDDPYNTYKYKGLPPGPIGNPGRAMLDAALHPESSPYLYYLHDSKGNIYYARTYQEHLANRKNAGL